MVNGQWIRVNRATRKIFRVAVLCIAFSIFNFQFSIAQKFPERRITREGTELYDKGDFTGAENEYRRALELNPELREANFNLGGALWRQALSQSAEGAQGNQGEQAAGQAAGQGAEQDAGQAAAQGAADAWTAIAADSLAPAPMISAASYNLGNVALVGQQIDAAIEAYKQALRLQPDDMEAKYNLAYAQKMKQEQEQNEDENRDEQQDGGGGQNDQNEDQNKDQNDNGDNQNDQQNGDGQNDPQDGDGDQNKNGGGDEPPPPPSGEGEGNGKPKMDPNTAQQMLDAMQAAEDDTREKVNAKEVQVGARSGKNW
jgi:tetratricopeptide (TPR) repeat protein